MTKTKGWVMAMTITLTFGCSQAPPMPVAGHDVTTTSDMPGTATMPVLGPRNLPLADLRQEFDTNDLDHDGIITRAEYGQAYPSDDPDGPAWREAAFATNVDLDGDGRVGWDEYQAADKLAPAPVLPTNDPSQFAHI